MMPGWRYTAWLVALACAVVATLAARPEKKFRALDAGFVLLLIVVTIFMVMLSLYLTWTDIGEARIDGIRGRYFLPFLPFLALILPGLGDRIDCFSRTLAVSRTLVLVFTIPSIAIAALDISGIPAIIFNAFGMLPW